MRPTVLTVGTFDGVHRGHRALLARARARARARGGDVLAVAFQRPPRLFFAPSPRAELITLPSRRNTLLRAAGADRALSLPFTKALSRRTADDFLRTLVRRRWRASEIVVGHDFAFGRGRAGTATALRAWGRRHGLRVHVVGPVRRGEAPVSSGRIRALLRAGDVDAAADLLARPFDFEGEVVRGRGLARRLGRPTANLRVDFDQILPPGVFAAGVVLPSGTRRGGMLNIGTRPTIVDRGRIVAEAHLFDFVGDLRGQTLRVFPLGRLREERRFPSRNALRRQWDRDERNARRVLSRSRWLAFEGYPTYP